MVRNKYPEITEARILDTATRLFLKKGWEQTTGGGQHKRHACNPQIM